MRYIPTMPKYRTSSAIAFFALIPMSAWAQAPAPAAAPPGSVQAAQAAVVEPPTEAELSLEAAVKKLAALKSVSSDILQLVDMLDQRFEIKGRYLRGGNHRIYLRLAVTGLVDAEGEMLQVCDGQTLWDYQQILESKSFRKTEVGEIFEKLKSPDLDDKFRDLVIAQLGFSGPEELLKGLRRSVKFDQKSSETLDGKDVWVLRGEWKSRDGLLSPNNQPIAPTAALPAYVPSLVIVWVDKASGWPHKVRLVGKKPTIVQDTRKTGADGQRIGAKSSIQEVKPTVMVLTYSNLLLNPDLKQDDFAFQAPPGARVEDSTQQILSGLDQQILGRAAQRKNEAAKGENPALLNESIPVPRTDAPPEAVAPPR